MADPTGLTNRISAKRLEEMQAHVDEGGALKCDQELLNEIVFWRESTNRLNNVYFATLQHQHTISKRQLLTLIENLLEATTKELQCGNLSAQEFVLKCWREYQDDLRPEKRNRFMRAYDSYFKSLSKIKDQSGGES